VVGPNKPLFHAPRSLRFRVHLAQQECHVLNQIPSPLPDFKLQQMDDEIVLYHPAQTRIVYLNQSASLVWSLCDGVRTTQDIIDLLAEAYPDAAGEIPTDVQAAIQQFLENGCIELAGTATP